MSPALHLNHRSFLLVLLLLALVVPLLAWSVLRLEGPRIRNEALGNLAAIGRLKSDQIETWISERRGDAEVLVSRRGLVNDVQRWFELKDAAARERIDKRFAALRPASGFQDVVLLDVREQASLAGDRGKLVAVALADGQVHMSQLYRDATGVVWLDFIAPVIQQGEGRAAPVGAVVLRARASDYLFPLVQTWPTASRSAETLLVRQEGGQALFLNDLRYHSRASLNLRLPLMQADLPASVALRERRIQALQGHDYRSVAVLAAMRPVQGTDWMLVAKVDLDEVQQPLYQLVSWVALVALAAIVAVGLLLRRLWRQQAKGHRLELIARTADRDRLLKLFYDLPFMGMGIVDPRNLHWLHVNDRMCEMLGYTREELLGFDSCEHLGHPDDRAAERPQLERLMAGEING